MKFDIKRLIPGYVEESEVSALEQEVMDEIDRGISADKRKGFEVDSLAYDDPGREAEAVKKVIKKNAKKWDPGIQALYEQFCDHPYIRRTLDMLSCGERDNKVKQCCIFITYTADDHKIFAVDMQANENIYVRNKNDKLVKFLGEQKGIEQKILFRNLTDLEAFVGWRCLLAKYMDQGEYLLNSDVRYYGHRFDDIPAEVGGKIPCIIYKNSFYKRYCPDIYNQSDSFDEVSVDDFQSVWFYDTSDIRIVDWIKKVGGNIVADIGKTTKSVIVEQWIPYVDYYNYKQKGLKVFNAADVLAYITGKEPQKLFKGRKPVIPKYDVAKRDALRAFICACEKQRCVPGKSVVPSAAGAPALLDGVKVDPLVYRDAVELKQHNECLKILKEDKPRGLSVAETRLLVYSRERVAIFNEYKDFAKFLHQRGLFDEEIKLLLSAKGLGVELSKAREAKEIDELGV